MAKQGFDNKKDFFTNTAENVLAGTNNIFSIKPTAKYLSGARTLIKINGELSAFAFQISWRINTSYTEVNTIDDYAPYELAPQRLTVEGNIGGFHIPGKSATVDAIQADALSFLFHRYITIEVRDSSSNELLFYTPRAVITSRSEDISAESLARVSLSFKAIGWKDELVPGVPPQS
jgi:hypothetical protein